MREIAIPLLMVLPGVWLAFGPRRCPVTWTAKLALAVALSPLVLGIQMLGLKLLGMGFAQSAVASLLFNIPALALLVVRTQRATLAREWLDWPIILTATAFCSLFLVYPWISSPRYRIFGWHNLMQIDIIYTLTADSTILPEEPQMAGLPLAYPWFAHLHTAVIGWISNIAPTRLVCIVNPLLLLACVTLWYESARRLGLARVTSTVVVGLIASSGNIVASAAGSLLGEFNWFGEEGSRFVLQRLGDSRTGPPLLKFQQIQAMCHGLVAYSGLLFVCLSATLGRLGNLSLMVGSLLLAVGLTYSSIAPASAIPAALLLGLLIVPLSADMPSYRKADVIALGVSILAAGLVTYIYLKSMTRQLTAPGAVLITAPLVLFRKALKFCQMVIVPGLPAVIQLQRTWRSRNAPGLLLGGAAIASMLLYICTHVGGGAGIEYKFVYCAIIPLGLLAGGFVDGIGRRHPRSTWLISAGVFSTFLLIQTNYGFRQGKHLAPYQDFGPRVDERSFWLDLQPDEKDSRWVRLVREQTPQNTVVITDQTRHHLATYMARSLFVPTDRSRRESRAGYEESGRFSLVGNRNYPAIEFDRRISLIDRLYAEADQEKLRAIVADIRSLGRPIVIYFDRQNVPALDWLKSAQLGSALYRDERSTVWFIDSDASR